MPDGVDLTKTLPDEILIEIFSYVLGTEINTQQKLFADKRWHRISQNEGLWKHLYGHLIGDPASISVPVTQGIYRQQCLRIIKEYQKLPDNHKLGYSVYYGYDRLLKHFLEKNPNADLHFRDRKGKKLIHAIHLATAQGHMSLVDILLSCDPTALNAKDIIGWTPLHYACTGDHTKMVEMLLSQNAQINFVDLTEALTAKILLFDKTKFVTVTEGREKLPLHIAAEKGHLEVVKVFLKYITSNKEKDATVGEVLDKQDKFGWTALHYACANGHREIIEKLLEAGAKSDLVTTQQSGWTTTQGSGLVTSGEETILHLACRKNDTDIVKFLAIKQPDLVKIYTADGYSILHYVCAMANLELVKFFIEHHSVQVIHFNNTYHIYGRTPYDVIPSGATNRQQIIAALKEVDSVGIKRLKKLKDLKKSCSIACSAGVIFFLVGSWIVIIFNGTNTIRNDAVLSPVLFGAALIFMIAGLTCLYLSYEANEWHRYLRSNFASEVQNGRQPVSDESLSHAMANKRAALLEVQENNAPNSYANFLREISQENKDSNNEITILNLDEDDDSLIDKRKIAEHQEQTSDLEIETPDIETGNTNTEEKISVTAQPHH